MYLMYGDEADAEEGRGQRFFLYGGVFIDQSKIWTAHERIEQLRKDAGFAAGDSLKFAAKTKPAGVTAGTHRDVKKAVIALAEELEVIFCAYVILHAIGRVQQKMDLVEYGANTVLARFNEFLTERNEHSIAKLDRMGKNAFTYAREKFQRGLTFPDTRDRRLDRIVSIGFTCDGASHLSSLADIVLGSFRYCVNESDKDEAGKAMFPGLMRLMWKGMRNGRRYVRERGLTLRPEKVQSRRYQSEYEVLLKRLQGYLDAEANQAA